MKKILLVGLLGFASSFVAGASTLCSTITTMAALQAAGVCTAQNVLFSFDASSYNAGDTGITADHVAASLNSTAFAGTIQVGWSFSPDGGNAWATNVGQIPMSIGYSVRLCTAADVIGLVCNVAATPLQSFTAAKAAEFAAFGSSNPTMTNDFTGNLSGVLHLPTDNSSNAANTNSSTFSTGNTSVSPVLSTSSGGGALFTIQDLIIETTAPEPGTAFLLGGSLIMIGLKLKRFTRNRTK